MLPVRLKKAPLALKLLRIKRYCFIMILGGETVKIKTIIENDLKETEIIIKCSAIDDEIVNLTKLLSKQQPVAFSKDNTDYFFSVSEVLFFETEDNKIFAQTANDSYVVKEKLYELEQKLPAAFLRISKSTILNINKIHSITRNLTAASLVEFIGTHKKVYVSRRYYALLRQKLENKE